ncbi:MAG: Bro-N domain-containing protein [Clostridiales bacterium]|nr:Bro-N domain-containing protein [Clostridiales bacterium]MDU7245322.1 Bro-N domain-containing protein [Clostridiales bacterium]
MEMKNFAEGTIRTFNRTQAYRIRAFIENGEPWFIASDVCRALGIIYTYEAYKMLKPEDKMKKKIPSVANCVSEWGVYQIILSCKSSHDEEQISFVKDWIRGEIIPALQEDYPTGDEERIRPESKLYKSFALKTFLGKSVLTIEDVAYLLKCNIQTAKWLIDHHKIKSYEIPGSAVEFFKKENKIRHLAMMENGCLDLYRKNDVYELLRIYRPEAFERRQLDALDSEEVKETSVPEQDVKLAVYQVQTLLTFAGDWEDSAEAESYYNFAADLLIRIGDWDDKTVKDLYNQEHWDYGLIKGLAVAASMV